MKIKNEMVAAFLLTGSVTAMTLSGCSSFPTSAESGRDVAPQGPTILNAHSEPGTIELNQALQPIGPAAVVADVKDFTSPLAEVKLRFVGVPMEVPMQNIGGTTWQAVLTQQELQALAVSGKTIKYEADVLARDSQGRTTETKSPVTVTIQADEVRAPASK